MTAPYRLIGITGRAGSGTDTAADHLVSAHAFRKVSFAGPLKDGLCAMFGWTPEQINDRVFKETKLSDIGKSPRQLMQLLGTEYGRELVHPDLWLILARKRIEHYMQYRSVVVSDVRFDNEADMIRSMGGQIIHLVRPGIGAVAAHKSESGVAVRAGDVEYVNNGTIGELHDYIGGWALAHDALTLAEQIDTADGWIEWSGGDWPMPPTARVQVQFDDGDVETNDVGQLRWDWQYGGHGGDIVAYRVVAP